MSVHENQKVFSTGQDLEDADRAAIMLHGRGATAGGMLRMTEDLPDAAYLAPQAANRTWYPHSFMEPRPKNQPHLDSALDKVGAVLETVSEHLEPEKVVILGFSQGACLASEFIASNPTSYGGLIALSGGLIGEEIEDFEGDLEQTPVFIGCSESDPHIPLERVEKTEQVMNDLKGDVEKYIFEGPHHGIVDYEIERVRNIISDI